MEDVILELPSVEEIINTTKEIKMEDVILELPSVEEIAQHYSSLMDSVHLLEEGKPDSMEYDDWVDCVSRNKEHLELMIDKDYWTNEDFTRVTAVLA